MSSQKIIENCFRKSGFGVGYEPDLPETDLGEDEPCYQFEELSSLCRQFNPVYDVVNYLNIDVDLETDNVNDNWFGQGSPRT